MHTSLQSARVLSILVLATSFSCTRHPSPPIASVSVAAAADRCSECSRRLPAAFVPNVGQWDQRARYVASAGAMTLFLEAAGWTFTLVTGSPAPGIQESSRHSGATRGVAVRMSFAGAGQPELIAEHRLPGHHHYLLGDDPARWRRDVPRFGAVRYREMHAGIDVRVRECDQHFEYDLLIEPGANLDGVEIAVDGIDSMHVDADNALVLATELGPVRMPMPGSWEVGPLDEHRPIECRYELRGADRFGFVAPSRQAGWALVVDPGLVWSTLLGGNDIDHVRAVAIDAQGAATVVGNAGSSDFPTTPGAFDPNHGGGTWDAVVTRLTPAGDGLVYSTFLGGSDDDLALAIALDAQGNATVAGSTSSANFPTTPGAFDQSHNGGRDAFVARLSASGSSLVYATLLGGTLDDQVTALALDAQGAATVGGLTASANFPVTAGAFATTFLGGSAFVPFDAFVARLSPMGGGLAFSTFVGGSGGDQAAALAIDAQGATTVVGWTYSTDFPTTPAAFDTNYNGGVTDAFVSRLSPSGASLVYSTYLGGADYDFAFGVAVDTQGVATVAGYTHSANYPNTPGAFDTSFNSAGLGVGDAIVTQLAPSGASLRYSTFLGGTYQDYAVAVTVDARGAAVVTGVTNSTDFPATAGAFDTILNNGSLDGFVARLAPAGSGLEYATYLGGTLNDAPQCLALDALGVATVAGITWAADFPTTPGAFDTTFDGAVDGFVARLDLLPIGAVAYGNSSPGCAGPLAITVDSMPRIGNTSFALHCGNVGPNSVGLIAFTAGALPSPVIVLGVEMWIDPAAFFVTRLVSSNAQGAGVAPLPIPNQAAAIGLQLFAQFLWAGPSAPVPCPPQGFSASNALAISIQP